MPKCILTKNNNICMKKKGLECGTGYTPLLLNHVVDSMNEHKKKLTGNGLLPVNTVMTGMPSMKPQHGTRPNEAQKSQVVYNGSNLLNHIQFKNKMGPTRIKKDENIKFSI